MLVGACGKDITPEPVAKTSISQISTPICFVDPSDNSGLMPWQLQPQANATDSWGDGPYNVDWESIKGSRIVYDTLPPFSLVDKNQSYSVPKKED